MYAVALLRYRTPIELVAQHLPAHRDFLHQLQQEGILLAAGRMDPRHGGMLLLRVPDDAVAATLDRVRETDPFTKAGVAQYEVIPWVVTLGMEALERI